MRRKTNNKGVMVTIIVVTVVVLLYVVYCSFIVVNSHIQRIVLAS